MSKSLIQAINMGKKSTPEEIFNNWKATGLLTDISAERQIEAALLLEDMAKYIMFVTQFRSFPEAALTFVFPIMARIMRDKEIYSFNSKSLFKDICAKWLMAEDVFDYRDDTGRDFQAEFCTMYASKYEDPMSIVKSIIEPNVKQEEEKNSVWVGRPYQFRSPGVYVREQDINYVFGTDPANENNEISILSEVRYSG